MDEPHEPVVGNWYTHANGELFEVVAYDATDESIDIQHFDGSLEEWDLDMWLELQPWIADPPEDWSGSLDITSEDYDLDTELPAAPESVNPLGNIDRL